jgi:hypothetical protein
MYMFKQIEHKMKKLQKMTKPKLWYAHITRTHTHCYINCKGEMSLKNKVLISRI